MDLSNLGASATLDSALHLLRSLCGGYSLLEHYQQGEFHHDLVFRLAESGPFPAPVLVISTNCNGGVKEWVAVSDVPSLDDLWHWRCPDNAEFAGTGLDVRAHVRTPLWFEPCELLADDARSELRPEHRERERGGGWVRKGCRRP